MTAGLLKLWMRSLPEPLLTFELYDSFIQAVSKCPISVSLRTFETAKSVLH